MRLVSGTLRCRSSYWKNLRAYLRSRHDIVYNSMPANGCYNSTAIKDLPLHVELTKVLIAAMTGKLIGVWRDAGTPSTILLEGVRAGRYAHELDRELLGVAQTRAHKVPPQHERYRLHRCVNEFAECTLASSEANPLKPPRSG